ncbi:MAG: electron transport complex subunit RsxE [Myxococcota bacterium]|jgi:electron transport complex protein RnfE|nr:electron transport complex subunit E [Myxococcota bacterium]MBP8971348.1 electron transport complex subunit E [Myxococcota bacterium]HHW96598.1 electron transport complex subunit E [Oligoflexales bacterium]
MSNQSLGSVFTRGLIKENPLLVLLLGMCPSLAVTTSVMNGLGMGVAVIFVLMCSNIVISLLRKVIPSAVRIPAFVVVIASFVTIVDMVMEGFAPDLHAALGVFIPLIVVNCIILARAEAFASKNSVLASAIDGLGMGLGFTLALVLVSAVREILGNGSILGINILGEGFAASPVLIMILPPGGFLTLGIIIAIMNKLRRA